MAYSMWISGVFTVLVVCQKGLSQPDLLCNQGSSLSCLCYSGDGSMRKEWPSCQSYIFESKLTAASLIVEQNFFVQRPDFVWPEAFLRQRLEPLINKFCFRDAEKCAGTALPIFSSMIFLISVTPTQSDLGITTVLFTVLNSRHYREVRQKNVMNASLLVDITQFQKDELGRMLGGSKVRALQAETISVVGGGRTTNVTNLKSADNEHNFFSTVTIVLGLIGLILVIIYLVAIVKAVRDRSAMKERNRQRLARRKLTALSDDLVAKIPHNTAVPSTSIPTTSQVPEAISSYDNCASSPPEAPPRHLVWKAAPKGARRSLSSDLYNLLRSSDNDPIIKNKTRRSATSHSFPLALPDFFLKSSRRPSGSDDVCLLETFRAGESASQPPDFPCPQPPTPPPVPPRKTPFTSPSAVTEAKVSPQVGLLTFDDFKWADPTIFTPVVEERTVAHLGHVSEEGSEDENDNSAVTGDFNRKLLGPPQVTILLPSDTTENLVCPSVSSGSLASSTGSEESADSDKRQNLQTTYEPLAESLWSLNK